MSFIDWDKIEHKGTHKGNKKTVCPVCSPTRTNKTDRCLSVDFDNGLAYCHHCEAKGFRDEIVNTFVLPSQNYIEHTNIPTKVLEWFKTRLIGLETINNLFITVEDYYQPQIKKNVSNIVFNYFEGEKLVNKKYRSGGKCFTQSKDTKSIFYNINAVIGQKECYIVEGEMDVLAMYEAGFKNVISVPNGANDNSKFWVNSEKYIKSIKKFIIGTDKDDKGIKLREDIAHRLGRYRCEFIEWDGKDANDDLISGKISDSVKGAKKFPIKGITNPIDLKDDVFNLYDNGVPKTIRPSNSSFGSFNHHFSLLEGQLTVITGIPSHGKSTWLEWYVLNLMKDYDFVSSFFSPEHSPISLHLTNFAQKIIGKPFFGSGKMLKSEVDTALNWLDNKMYFMHPEGNETPTWKWLIESFTEQIYAHGVKIFVIDAFNKLLLPKGNKLDEINNVLTKLTSFAQTNDVLIFLVAHPTKMQLKDDGTYREPTLYDVSGSSDFRNQTHNGICVYRTFKDENTDGFTTIRNLKTKFSFQGEIGESCDFGYDVRTGRYMKDGYPSDVNSFIGKQEIRPDMFKVEDDAPF